MVTQIKVDQELSGWHCHQTDTGLDNTQEIRDAMLDQVMWQDFRG